jgi:hypothetical protein
LTENCCDSRIMNCEKLIAFGPNFSTNDTLFYKMELFLPNSSIKVILTIKETTKNYISFIKLLI